MSKIKVFILLIFLLFALTACASKSPTETAVETDDPAVEASTVPVSNECLNCHTDKQRLVDSAKPEELAESESKGVG